MNKIVTLIDLEFVDDEVERFHLDPDATFDDHFDDSAVLCNYLWILLLNQNCGRVDRTSRKRDNFSSIW